MIKIINPLFFFVTISAVAQTYTIPGATEQPEWVFPLWFEDGTGARDTLYFGYDSNGQNFDYPQADTIFGEILSPSDTSKFMVYWEQGFTINEVLKVLIWKNFYQSTIFFNKAKLPIKITWDNELFYSNNLPYPSQLPLPNAWGLVHCAGVGFEGCQITEEDAIVITDTPNEAFWPTWETDSLWFNSEVYEYFLNYLHFEVLEYGYAHGWMVIENEINQNGSVGPNPADYYIKLYIDSYLGGNVYITNITGQVIREYRNINSDLVNLIGLPSGIYLLNFYNQKNQLTQKFIKL